MTTSYVIIGDGISGSSAAETIREKDPDGAITVITDEGEALYNRILIKEFAKGKLPEAPIAIHDPEWYEDRDIDLQLNTHVTHIDTDQRVIETHDAANLEYDKLLVATGGTPAQLPVPNSDLSGIHHFWTFQDARRIKEHASTAETGAVIGAGLLGIDLAAIAGIQGVKANYLMRGNRWWRYALSLEGAEIIHNGLRDLGVNLVFESSPETFEADANGNVTAVVDDNGDRYEAEFVGIAIGLNFNTEFLQSTEVKCEAGILVDEYMRTNVDGVYASGDITRFHDVLIGERAQNGSWGSAKEQGRVAATNMAAGEPVEEFRWVSSYSITHFDFPFLSFGHPTEGDEHIERKFDDGVWRRLALKDGKIIGGVLIGDLAPQTRYKKLIREEVDIQDKIELLLEEKVDLEKITPA